MDQVYGDCFLPQGDFGRPLLGFGLLLSLILLLGCIRAGRAGTHTPRSFSPPATSCGPDPWAPGAAPSRPPWGGPPPRGKEQQKTPNALRGPLEEGFSGAASPQPSCEGKKKRGGEGEESGYDADNELSSSHSETESDWAPDTKSLDHLASQVQSLGLLLEEISSIISKASSRSPKALSNISSVLLEIDDVQKDLEGLLGQPSLLL